MAYVLSLNCTIHSIVQLVNEFFSIIMFSHKLCVIHDHSMRRLIKVGGERSAFKEVQPEEALVNQVVKRNIWQCN